eukprot:gene6151-4430_t
MPQPQCRDVCETCEALKATLRMREHHLAELIDEVLFSREAMRSEKEFAAHCLATLDQIIQVLIEPSAGDQMRADSFQSAMELPISESAKARITTYLMRSACDTEVSPFRKGENCIASSVPADDVAAPSTLAVAGTRALRCRSVEAALETVYTYFMRRREVSEGLSDALETLQKEISPC